MTTMEQFSYHLIRNDVLRDLLGTNHDEILYWAGRSLARKYPLTTIEQLTDFFKRANWGKLTLQKERKYKNIYELTGEWMGKNDNRCYELESGFLAQQIELIKQAPAGATYIKKKYKIIITVQYSRQTKKEHQ